MIRVGDIVRWRIKKWQKSNQAARDAMRTHTSGVVIYQLGYGYYRVWWPKIDEVMLHSTGYLDHIVECTDNERE